MRDLVVIQAINIGPTLLSKLHKILDEYNLPHKALFILMEILS